METKKELRKRIIKERALLSYEERRRAEAVLKERIIEHQWFKKAKEVLLFVSYGGEIETKAIMEEAHRLRKKVYVPKIVHDKMTFYRIRHKEVLIEGYKGILEPDLTDAHECFVYTEDKAEYVLMIMPGVAFDAECNRVGYGKGFYDNYLADKDTLHTIAVGFTMQLVAEIESEGQDIRPMQVLCV